MKRYARSLAPLALLILLVSGMAGADQARKPAPRPDSMTLWQARRTLPVATEYLAWYRGTIDRNSFRFSPGSFEFDAVKSKSGTQHFKVDLQALEPVSIQCNMQVVGKELMCFLKNEVGKSRPLPLDLAWREGSVWNAKCSADCIYAAESFASALNRLRAFARDASSPLRTFTQRAAVWRALPAKPPVPEQVRIKRLLAENAVKEKRPEEALNQYESGLEIYPTWPQGCFNAALVAAELGFYADAVEHMQSYLELVPDAPDAQSARDQIVIWQDKTKENK